MRAHNTSAYTGVWGVVACLPTTTTTNHYLSNCAPTQWGRHHRGGSPSVALRPSRPHGLTAYTGVWALVFTPTDQYFGHHAHISGGATSEADSTRSLSHSGLPRPRGLSAYTGVCVFVVSHPATTNYYLSNSAPT